MKIVLEPKLKDGKWRGPVCIEHEGKIYHMTFNPAHSKELALARAESRLRMQLQHGTARAI